VILASASIVYLKEPVDNRYANDVSATDCKLKTASDRKIRN